MDLPGAEKMLEEMRDASEPLHHILWELSSHVVPKSFSLSTLPRIWCQDLNAQVIPKWFKFLLVLPYSSRHTWT